MILVQISLKGNVYPSWIAFQGCLWVILERVRTTRGPGGFLETVQLCHLWGRTASSWEHHHPIPLPLATCEANCTSCQQLWVFSVQFSLNPEDKHHNYANGAHKEKENTSRHLSETPYGGLKRFPWSCCSLDITVADAIHYYWKQRSYPAGSNSGRLFVSHLAPSPKWKFTEGIEKGSRAASDPHRWIILVEWLLRGPVGWPQGTHTHALGFYQAQRVPLNIELF